MLKETFLVIGNVDGKDSDGAINVQNAMARLSLELEKEATSVQIKRELHIHNMYNLCYLTLYEFVIMS